MYKGTLKIIYFFVIVFFLLFVFIFYFSEDNKNKIKHNRSNYNTNLYKQISDLPFLENDTDDVIEYNYDKCLTDMYQVPGYDEQCNWYHRPFVTSLAVNDENGDRFARVRRLKHGY